MGRWWFGGSEKTQGGSWANDREAGSSPLGVGLPPPPPHGNGQSAEAYTTSILRGDSKICNVLDLSPIYVLCLRKIMCILELELSRSNNSVQYTYVKERLV